MLFIAFLKNAIFAQMHSAFVSSLTENGANEKYVGFVTNKLKSHRFCSFFINILM